MVMVAAKTFWQKNFEQWKHLKVGRTLQLHVGGDLDPDNIQPTREKYIRGKEFSMNYTKHDSSRESGKHPTIMHKYSQF